MKKLLMSDYDQTLYTTINDLRLNIEAIKRFQNHNFKFAIVTGRSYERIKEEIDKYNIPYDYLSCVDGSMLYDNTDKLLKSYLLNENICNELKEKIDSQIDIEMTILKEENINNKNNIIECYYDVTKYDKIELLVNIVKKEILNYQNLKMKFIDFGIDKLLIITKKDITKKNAGIDIATIENISHDNIFSIGDHYNDLEMLESFNGYAMKNSEEILKTVSLGLYDNVSQLIDDIISNKVYTKKRG